MSTGPWYPIQRPEANRTTVPLNVLRIDPDQAQAAPRLGRTADLEILRLLDLEILRRLDLECDT